MTKVPLLLNRLWDACQTKPDFGGDLWARGLEVIQRRHGVIIYLSKFEPVGFVPGECSEAVTISVVGD